MNVFNRDDDDDVRRKMFRNTKTTFASYAFLESETVGRCCLKQQFVPLRSMPICCCRQSVARSAMQRRLTLTCCVYVLYKY